MRPEVSLPPEKLAAAIKDYVGGSTLRDIVAAHGHSLSFWHKTFAGAGVERRTSGPRPPENWRAELQTMRAMRAAGATWEGIGQALGFSLQPETRSATYTRYQRYVAREAAEKLKAETEAAA